MSADLKFYSPHLFSETKALFFDTLVQCGFTGFPSPADDHLQTPLDLNKYMNVRPSATFYVKATGQSMVDAGIDENDLLVVDRSLNPAAGRIAVCVLEGELVVKRIDYQNGKLYLTSANKNFKPVEIEEENDLIVWGVVSGVVKKLV